MTDVDAFGREKEAPMNCDSCLFLQRLEDLYAAYRFLLCHGPNSGGPDRWEFAKKRNRGYELEPFRTEAKEYVQKVLLQEAQKITLAETQELVDERNALLQALYDMVHQHCTKESERYFSSFLTSDSFALRLLCRIGSMRMSHDGFGRVVYAEDLPDEETWASCHAWRKKVCTE